jgi:hypothetical protein
MQRFFLCLLFVTPFLAQAQDITGVWQGHFQSEGNSPRSSIFDDRYRIEVQVAQHGKTFEGVTYCFQSSIFFYGKAAATGTVNVRNGKVLMQEGKLLEVKNRFGDGVCTMTYFMQYTKSGTDEFLEGRYVSMNLSDSSNAGGGTIILHKVPTPYFPEESFLTKRKKELANPPLAARPPAVLPPAATRLAATPPHPAKTPSTLPPHKKAPVTRHSDSTSVAASRPKVSTRHQPPPAPERNTPALARAATSHSTVKQPAGESTTSMNSKFPSITPRVLLDRATPLVRSLTVNTKDVVLNIYDDGAIDNDTISVYLDNRLILSHAMLTDRPIVLKVHLDESDDYHELVMVADNEGEIPPNTSLMIVKAGDKEYEVRITSTMQKNAKITFKYVNP